MTTKADKELNAWHEHLFIDEGDTPLERSRRSLLIEGGGSASEREKLRSELDEFKRRSPGQPSLAVSSPAFDPVLDRLTKLEARVKENTQEILRRTPKNEEEENTTALTALDIAEANREVLTKLSGSDLAIVNRFDNDWHIGVYLPVFYASSWGGQSISTTPRTISWESITLAPGKLWLIDPAYVTPTSGSNDHQIRLAAEGRYLIRAVINWAIYETTESWGLGLFDTLKVWITDDDVEVNNSAVYDQIKNAWPHLLDKIRDHSFSTDSAGDPLHSHNVSGIEHLDGDKNRAFFHGMGVSELHTYYSQIETSTVVETHDDATARDIAVWMQLTTGGSVAFSHILTGGSFIQVFKIK